MTHSAHQPPRAVLWDMDGTLLDSAEYHWLAWSDIVHAEGYPITYEEFKATFGRKSDRSVIGTIDVTGTSGIVTKILMSLVTA